MNNSSQGIAKLQLAEMIHALNEKKTKTKFT